MPSKADAVPTDGCGTADNASAVALPNTSPSGAIARNRGTMNHVAEALENASARIKRNAARQIGRASCRERVCQYVYVSVVAVSLKKKNKNIPTRRSINNNIDTKKKQKK